MLRSQYAAAPSSPSPHRKPRTPLGAISNRIAPSDNKPVTYSSGSPSLKVDKDGRASLSLAVKARTHGASPVRGQGSPARQSAAPYKQAGLLFDSAPTRRRASTVSDLAPSALLHLNHSPGAAPRARRMHLIGHAGKRFETSGQAHTRTQSLTRVEHDDVEALMREYTQYSPPPPLLFSGPSSKQELSMRLPDSWSPAPMALLDCSPASTSMLCAPSMQRTHHTAPPPLGAYFSPADMEEEPMAFSQCSPGHAPAMTRSVPPAAFCTPSPPDFPPGLVLSSPYSELSPATSATTAFKSTSPEHQLADPVDFALPPAMERLADIISTLQLNLPSLAGIDPSELERLQRTVDELLGKARQ